MAAEHPAMRKRRFETAPEKRGLLSANGVVIISKEFFRSPFYEEPPDVSKGLHGEINSPPATGGRI
jgi:hypothetical protein